MSTTTILLSPDGETRMPAAGSRLVTVDAEQYANDPDTAIAAGQRILTLPAEHHLPTFAAAFTRPPAGPADPQELALARLLADVAFGVGGLADDYRLVPAEHDGHPVLVFAEASSEGAIAIGELWPPREHYETLPPGDDESSEPLLDRPFPPPLQVAVFPRYRDGRTGDLITELSGATPTALLRTLAAALRQVEQGIDDPAGSQTTESRAIGIDVTLLPTR